MADPSGAPPAEDPLAEIKGATPEADAVMREYFSEPDGDIRRLHVIDAPRSPRAPLVTNAPASWPPVMGPLKCEGEPDAFAASLALLITQALKNAGISVVEYHREVELSEFTLVVDLVARVEGADVPILILPGADPGREREDFDLARITLAKEGPFVGSPCYFYTPSGASAS